MYHASTEDKETVELFFSCRNLKDKDVFSKSDPLLILKKQINQNQWVEIGQTEMVKNNLNPDFAKSFKIEFFFEIKQIYKVEVIDVDNETTLKGDYLGSANFELADIVGSIQNMKILRLKDLKNKESGKCIVRLDKIGEEEEKKILTLKFGIDNVIKTGFFSSKNTFIKIYKLRIVKSKLDRIKQGDVNIDSMKIDDWVLTYKSKNIKGNNIEFNQFDITSSKISNNYFDIPLKIEMLKYKSNGSHKILGTTYIKILDFISQKRSFPFKKKQKQIKSTLKLLNFKINTFHNFLDYLKGGMNINLSVGIDFTASNRDPQDPKSLHHINPPQLNLYQQAILSVGEILKKYNHTHQIPSFGFGAKVGNPLTLSHVFPINNNPQFPFVKNFQELFQAYHFCLQNIQFSGPTFFAPIIKNIVNFTNENFKANYFNYSVFLLLTDGIIMDLDETVDCIVGASLLPLSIVIVGIGDENFERMEFLDADDNPLMSSGGEVQKRDIVQFVPFKKFKNNPFILREEVLREIPGQVEQFYRMKGIKPNKMNVVKPEMLNFQRGNTLGVQNKFQDAFLEENNHNYPVLK